MTCRPAGAARWTPATFKKGGRKLCFCIDWVPRGRRSDFAPNQYVNWVQAQPAVTWVQAQPAVNWVQAQPAVNWVQAQPALLKKVDENFIFAETGC